MADNPNALDAVVMKRVQHKVNAVVLRGLRFILNSSALEENIRKIIREEPSGSGGGPADLSGLTETINTRVRQQLQQIIYTDNFREILSDIARGVLGESRVFSTSKVNDILEDRINEIEEQILPDVLRSRLRVISREDLEERLMDFEEEILHKLPSQTEEIEGTNSAEVQSFFDQNEEIWGKIREMVDVAVAEASSALKTTSEISRNIKGSIETEVSGDKANVIVDKVLESLSDTFTTLEKSLNLKINKTIEDLNDRLLENQQKHADLEKMIEHELEIARQGLAELLGAEGEKFLDIERVRAKIREIVDHRVSSLTMDLMNQVQVNTLAALDPSINERLDDRLPRAIESVVAHATKNLKDDILDELNSIASEMIKFAVEEEKSNFQPVSTEQLEEKIDATVKQRIESVQTQALEAVSAIVVEELSSKTEALKKDLANELSEDTEALKESLDILEKNLFKKLSDEIDRLIPIKVKALEDDVITSVNRNLRGIMDRLTQEMKSELVQKIEIESEATEENLKGRVENIYTDMKKEAGATEERLSRDILRIIDNNIQAEMATRFGDMEAWVNEVKKSMESADFRKQVVEELTAEMQKTLTDDLYDFKSLFEDKFNTKLQEDMTSFKNDVDEKITNEISQAGQLVETHFRDNIASIVEETMKDTSTYSSIEEMVNKKITKQFTTLGNLLERSFEDKLLATAETFISKKIAKEFGTLGTVLEKHFEQNISASVDTYFKSNTNDLKESIEAAIEARIADMVEEKIAASFDAHTEDLVLRKINEVLENRETDPGFDTQSY